MRRKDNVKTNSRASLGTVLWVFGFNLAIAMLAYFWGIHWAILILCLRHLFLRIPHIYEFWRKIVVGREAATHLTAYPNISWPNRSWLLKTFFCICLSIVSFIWLDWPLKNILIVK